MLMVTTEIEGKELGSVYFSLCSGVETLEGGNKMIHFQTSFKRILIMNNPTDNKIILTQHHSCSCQSIQVLVLTSFSLIVLFWLPP